MERGDYWSALVRGWWLIVTLGLVGLALGLVSPRHQVESSYVSTSNVGSPPPATTTGADGAAEQIMFYGSSDSVYAAAAKGAGLDWPTWEVRSRLQLLGPPAANGSATGPTSGQPGVIEVKVTAPTLHDSLDLNNAYDQALGDQLTANAQSGLLSSENQTEQKLASIMKEIASNQFPPGITPQALDIQVTALQNALATLVISSPGSNYSILHTAVLQDSIKVTTGAAVNSRALRAAAGLLIGLILGAIAAIALWLLDRRLKTAKRAQIAFGYPVVAEIPSSSSDATEPYRMLWLSVFREPLPPPPLDGSERWYDGENPLLDAGVGSASGQAEIT